jgi:hypothetical protein
MTDLLVDGNVKVSFLPAVSNIHAPTTTELNAGTSLETFITPTGYKNKPSTAPVITSSLASKFETQGAGRSSFAISLELKRQTGVDAVYNLLAYQVTGYLAVRRNLDRTTAWAPGQAVEIYPVQCGRREQVDPAPNEVAKYVSSMFMTADPDDAAVVA